AAGNPTDPGNSNPSCVPVEKFNLGVFQKEILPILTGDLDLNRADHVGNHIGCVFGSCHGTDRGPGTLTLKRDADPATNLQNFACFVSRSSPGSSEIVTCPSNAACRRSPHPGQEVFQGAQDLNYQKVLGFVYGANVASSPLDFAFFVRKINPIFNDFNAVEAG